MRRLLAITLSLLVVLGVLYAIGSSGSPRHTNATSDVPPAAKHGARTATPPPATETSTAPTTTVITATRTDCRWRQYRDRAIASDPARAPGMLDPAATGNIAQTVCNPAWVAAASQIQPPPVTLDKLLIEYQLPGNLVTYALARVVPVEDGGSPTSPLNLYPLPLNGFGGQQTQTVVANQIHHEICSHKITIAQAAKTLQGDWLSRGLPNND
jgi:hypothetical protein